MAQIQKKYDTEYKVQAIKLAKEIGTVKAAAELGIPVNTIYGWQKAVREGRLDVGSGAHTPPDSDGTCRGTQYPAEKGQGAG